MTHSHRVSGPPPSKMTPATRWLLAALFGSAVVVSLGVVWLMYHSAPDGHGHDKWVQPSASSSAITDPADVGKLRSLHAQVEHADDQLQKAQATANADPDSDASVDLVGNAQEDCADLQYEYDAITDQDPAAAAAAKLPRRLTGDSATDCAADHPNAVASLPTVSVSGIPAAD